MLAFAILVILAGGGNDFQAASMFPLTFA